PSALPSSRKGGLPQTYTDNLRLTNPIGEKLKSPYTINMNFSIGREFSHGLFIQGSYVGRLSPHSLTKTGVAMPTNLKDSKSGQTWFQAAQAMSKLARANTDTSKVQPIPFFEN